MDTPTPQPETNGKPELTNDSGRGPRLREIPLRLVIPNLVTVLAICAGLSGVRLAFEGRFELAVAMVLLAAFLDGIDGRLARMMKATSKFGAQMDSLADIVNFGVAPALVLYAYVLDQARSFGWIAALIYVIAAGLRLARFNVMIEREVKAPWQNEFFVGVPAPMGAMLVLLPVYLGFIGVEPGKTFGYISAFYTVLIGYFLISRLPVWSGKSESSIRRDRVLPAILIVVLYVALLMSFTWEVLIVTVAAYLIFLPFSARLWHKRYGTLTIEEDAHGEAGNGLDRGL
ncbi:CDP-diacylglycerol--serine O-phosphatidyltransferase [Agrobacterium larrymoorei]|uniref:CDP-diacylglycerol--serine O-phosphatidyltransferase n=1 Tax=Agrobacterium larrymoorei TaxID=160699 RepID=UPI001573C67E|nr:CDP-diacylglycerol--serine O-phosphatidyltransferase [Agrobacterium larrymoorei]NTJ41995.1 CDP-diacylglycerol--serine O-phosphatidyltransferase [Agrobacterium larrymoorei]